MFSCCNLITKITNSSSTWPSAMFIFGASNFWTENWRQFLEPLSWVLRSSNDLTSIQPARCNCVTISRNAELCLHCVEWNLFAVANRTCSTVWLPQDETNDFKDIFLPGCLSVVTSLASRLQKKYSQVSVVMFKQIYTTANNSF